MRQAIAMMPFFALIDPVRGVTGVLTADPGIQVLTGWPTAVLIRYQGRVFSWSENRQSIMEMSMFWPGPLLLW